MSNIQLPEPAAFREYSCEPLYTADQVREYARAAIEADRWQRNADESDALTVAHMAGYDDGRKAAVKESLTVEQERAAFEAWAAKFFMAAAMGRDSLGFYIQDEIDLLWDAWQARAALKGDV